MQDFANDYPIVVLIVSVLGALVLYLLPAARLLTRTVYRNAALRHVRAVIKAIRFLPRIRPRAMYRAACLWIEMELLDPRPPRPESFGFKPKSEYRVARRKYRAESEEWRAQAWERLGDLM